MVSRSFFLGIVHEFAEVHWDLAKHMKTKICQEIGQKSP